MSDIIKENNGITPDITPAQPVEASAAEAAEIDALLTLLTQKLEKFVESDPASGQDPVTFLENMINGNSSLSVKGGSDVVAPAPNMSKPQPQPTVADKDSLNEVQTLVETQDPAAETEEFVEFVDLLRSDIANNTTFLSSSTGFRAFDFNFDLTRNGLSSDFSELRKADTGLSSGGGLQTGSSGSTTTAGAGDDGSIMPSNIQPNNDSPSTPPPIKPDLFTAGSNTIDFNTVVLNNYTNNGVYDARAGDDIITLPDVANAVSHGFVIGTAFLAGLGNDQVTGGDGNDLIYGNDGNDILNGAGGNDSLLGGTGNDTLTGGLGNDVMDGGDGDDILTAGAGADSLIGGVGNDSYVLGVDGAADRIIYSGTADLVGSVDSVTSFQTGEDIIDISALLTGWSSIQHVGFFRLVDNGGDAELQVDVDGGGDGFVNIANLIGVNLGAGVELTDIYAGAIGNAFSANAESVNFNNVDSNFYTATTQYNAGDGADVVTLADAANEATAGYATGTMFYGESGNDTITGGDQGDKIDGGADNDVISGGTGNDSLIGGDGNDILTGGAGNDSLTAGDGIDSLIGGVGNDTYILNVDGAADRIIYNAGDTAGSAVDIITGFQDGEDMVDISALISNWDSAAYADFFRIVDNGADADLEIDADGGGDNFVKIATFTGVNLGAGVELTDILAGSMSSVFNSSYQYMNLNNLQAGWYAAGSQYSGGAGNDYVILVDQANQAATGFTVGTSFDAGAGNDVVIGGDGDDVILGGDGDDIIYGRDGEDTMDGGAGNDTFVIRDEDVQAAEVDVINNFVTGEDKIGLSGFWGDYDSGSASDFWQLVNNGADVDVQICAAGDGGSWVTVATVTGVQVGVGIDTTDIDAGDSLFTDGNDNITIYNYNLSDFVNVNMYDTGAGDDTVLLPYLTAHYTALGFDGTVGFHGGAGNDVITMTYNGAQNQAITVYGDEGNDTINTGSASDILYGGAGADSFNSSYGDDTIYGDEGNDTIVGGYGNDVLYGGDGDDTITDTVGFDMFYGGAGNDTINVASNVVSGYVDGGTGADIITSSGAATVSAYMLGGTGVDTLTAGNSMDTIAWRVADMDGSVDIINGFDTGQDLLNIKQLLINYDGNIANFVRFVDNGGNTVLQIDRDGVGGDWEDVAQLNGVTLGGGGVSLNDVDAGIVAGSNASAGADFLQGAYGDDVISGGDGYDVLEGRDGDDTLNGGNGNDLLRGGKGDDVLDGGAGNDVFMFRAADIVGGAVDTILNFATGADTFDLSGIWADYDSGNAGNFWRIVDNGANADIQISLAGDGANWITIATATGVNLGAGIETTDVFVGSALFGEDPTQIDFTSGLVAGTDYLDGTQYYFGDGNDYVLLPTTTALFTALNYDPSYAFHGGEGDDYITMAYNVQNQAVTIYGDDGNDSILTGAGSDLIYGGDGNDKISSSYGNDTLYGEDGNDSLYGLQGNDTLYGGDGDDTLNGYSDNDVLYGGDGNDTINETGAVGARDILFGEAGNDTIAFNSTTTYADGGSGTDIITANGAGTTFSYMLGGTGVDTLTAGDSTDTFMWRAADMDGSVDLVNGFDTGQDLLSIKQLLINYDGNIANFVRFVDNGGDTVLQIDRDGVGGDWEDVAQLNGVTLGGGGVSLNDVDAGIVAGSNASAGADFLQGAYGDDVISGGDGYDVLEGRDGDDTLNGGNGNDLLRGGKGDDVLDGGAGNDVFMFRAADIVGGAVDTILNFATGADTFDLSGIWADYDSGNAGNFWRIVDNGADADIQISLAGDGANWITIATATGVNLGAGIETTDVFVGSALFGEDPTQIDFTSGLVAGTDYLDGTQYYFGDGNDYVLLPTTTNFHTDMNYDPSYAFHGGEGDDYISVAYNVQNQAVTIYGDDGNDYIITGAGSDLIYGGDGNDSILSSYGADTLYGGDGDDFINGYYQNDILYGDAGDDTLNGYTENDTLYGGAGSDTLIGGTGTDVFRWSAGDFDNAELDTITDLADGSEFLDLANLLVGYTGPGDFTDFINIVSNGSGGTMVQLDLDGTANGVNFQDFVNITNVIDTNITAADFIMQ